MPPEQTGPMSKVCGVCNEPIRKYQGVHYGGVSCYSCRAFFRRLSQQSAKVVPADLRCVNGDSRRCVVDATTRRDCQRCRFDRCVAAGMRPELVLTEEAKAARFARTHKKWEEEERRSSVAMAAASAFGESAQKKQEKGQRLRTGIISASVNISSQASVAKSFTILLGGPLTRNNPSFIQYSVRNSCLKDAVYDPEHIEHLLNAFHNLCCQSSVNVLESSAGACVVNRLISIHLGEDHLDISDIAAYVQIHSRIFASFASSVPAFKELHPADRASLLKRSSRLHLSYVLTQYMTASSGRKQLEWLIGEASAFKAITSQDEGNVTSWNCYAKACVAYEFQEVMDVIHASKETISRFSSKSLMALALLFYGDGLCLKNGSNVLHYYNYYLKIIKGYLSNSPAESDIEEVISTLLPLANEFNKLLDPLVSQGLFSRISMHYTHEEELWLQHCLGQFDRAEKSVPLGEVVLEYYVLLSLGENVGHQVQHTMVNITKERSLRALKSHSEFLDLSDVNARSLWMMNTVRYMALNMALCHSGRTPLQQISLMMGDGDMSIWEAKFGGKNRGALRRVNGVSYNDSCGLLPPTMAADFAGQLERISKMLQNIETYQVLSLVMLLSPPPSPPCSPSPRSSPSESSAPSPPFARLLALRNRFIVALERRGVIKIEDFLRGIEDVQRLADILMLMA